jgi:hypothetical protein
MVVSVSVAPVSEAVGVRRRLRPYLVWLERSRDHWKDLASAARADVRSLRRQLSRVSASRERWRQRALGSRRQLRNALEDAEKNGLRS